MTGPGASVVVDDLVDAELRYLRERYGSRSAAPVRGSTWLAYHNADHSRFVHDSAAATARTLVATGEFTEADVQVVRLAAAFHDHEQDRGPGRNEAESADALRGALSSPAAAPVLGPGATAVLLVENRMRAASCRPRRSPPISARSRCRRRPW